MLGFDMRMVVVVVVGVQLYSLVKRKLAGLMDQSAPVTLLPRHSEARRCNVCSELGFIAFTHACAIAAPGWVSLLPLTW
jgi:hypothetical protein